jgi:hypothetical protein
VSVVELVEVVVVVVPPVVEPAEVVVVVLERVESEPEEVVVALVVVLELWVEDEERAVEAVDPLMVKSSCKIIDIT